jgi:hypothetical protein
MFARLLEMTVKPEKKSEFLDRRCKVSETIYKKNVTLAA